jgi:1-deoxy-D-xylulose-5-phosphate synthase
MLLDSVTSPAKLKALPPESLPQLAAEAREFIVNAVSATGGHLGSNLGVVELTFAIHRVFDSPKDVILWDTGHQAYVHKLITGRKDDFAQLRQPGGLSGYPSRIESDHDYIENSHASTVLSYAHGMAEAIKANKETDRRVVAIIGDGSMTGGMAYEALNNLGHTNSRVVIVLNDNGRSYAPTISGLTRMVSRIRTKPSYARGKKMSESIIESLPVVGELGLRTVKGMKAALRELADEPHAFFETLGVRYVGPVDGHDTAAVEEALRDASTYNGAIVVHVLTQKGKGYSVAEHDDEKNLHDVPVFDPALGPQPSQPKDWTAAFTDALLELGQDHPKLHAITAAMPGPTGLLPFQARFPDRFHDVGIAEQHAVTLAAGMAMGGLRPVVALYSTFLTRAIDQAMYDVGLHGLPVVFALDRSGITGPDGPSHHGVLDMLLMSKVPGATIFAPSSAQELKAMLTSALSMSGPVVIRYPKGSAMQVEASQVGTGLSARKVRAGGANPDVCIIAVGHLLEAASRAADVLQAEHGIDATVWDPRVVVPADEIMLHDAARYSIVVTIEDGMKDGGVGSMMVDRIQQICLAEGRQPIMPIVLGTPRSFIAHGKPALIMAELGLDTNGIVDTVSKAVAQHSSTSTL